MPQQPAHRKMGAGAKSLTPERLLNGDADRGAEDKVESASFAAPLPCHPTEEVFLYPDFESLRQPPSPARILVVGAGALGCAAARTLAQEPRVSLTIVDDDRIELSNLQRQVLYVDADIGRLKTEAAAERLESEFGAGVETHHVRFDAATGPGLLATVDLVIDATDDPATKFLIGRLCVEARTPYVYGGVARTGGQWLLAVPGESACLECVYPASPRPPSPARSPALSDAPDSASLSSRESPPSRATTSAQSPAPVVETAEGCAALGVLAPVAGVVGSMQALVALAYLRRPGRATPGRLHIYELTGARSRHIDFKPDPACFCSAAFQERTRHQARDVRAAARSAQKRTAS
jgi:molybdopterin-synthase adenylyltransferase